MKIWDCLKIAEHFEVNKVCCIDCHYCEIECHLNYSAFESDHTLKACCHMIGELEKKNIFLTWERLQ